MVCDVSCMAGGYTWYLFLVQGGRPKIADAHDLRLWLVDSVLRHETAHHFLGDQNQPVV